MKQVGFITLLFISCFAVHSSGLRSQVISSTHKSINHALVARLLVHDLDWGVLSTTSHHLNGFPYGNAVSYSDGVKSTGRLLFYLTEMDATAQDLAYHPNATLTICLAQKLPYGCTKDPEDPTCTKLSITGSVEPVPDEKLEEAKEMLFDRHPEMASWPDDHGFSVYEMHLVKLRLLDWYGGAKDIDVDDYFDIKLDNYGVYSIS